MIFPGFKSLLCDPSKLDYDTPMMLKDVTILLWALKLGAVLNLYFLMNAESIRSGGSDVSIVVPAQILFLVSAYRCVFPNRYKDNVVLHVSPLSSTLVTRVLATFAEVAWIYQLSYVIRLLNLESIVWVDLLSWLMVFQVILSQLCVWGAILTRRLSFYFYEEIGWGLIFLANTIASSYLYLAVDGLGDRGLLLQLNFLFGAVYLPWQLIHLRALRADADLEAKPSPIRGLIASQLRRSFLERNRATDAESWGGIVGLVWMTAYWAALIPVWVYVVVQILATE